MSTQENLEERIERIRKRNEELQKKHAEAEADKQKAKKENAMVQTKLTSYDDWPREHKYDNIEFNYDENEEIIRKMSDDNRDKKREKHNKSHFAEGDGPPPDPSYSFLKDADRDFNHLEQMRNKTNSNKKTQYLNQRGQQRGNQERNSFRGKSRRGGDFSHVDTQPAYDAWRCERNKIDEARINRQKNSEGKWRREWDIEKLNNEGPKEIFNTHKPEKYTIGDVLLTGQKKPIITHSNMDKNKDFNRARPNITVSLDMSGEVQSVKVSSPPAIGSGRVGPRQVKLRPHISDDIIDNKNTVLNDNCKIMTLHKEDNQSKKKDNSTRIKSPTKTDMHVNSGNNIQNRLNKFKKSNEFCKISNDIKMATQEIEHISLNKKPLDTHKDDSLVETITIDNLLKINKKEEIVDDFCLSTDLIIGTKERKNDDHIKNNLQCDFVNMATADIENFIEQEVEKNKISEADIVPDIIQQVEVAHDENILNTLEKTDKSEDPVINKLENPMPDNVSEPLLDSQESVFNIKLEGEKSFKENEEKEVIENENIDNNICENTKNTEIQIKDENLCNKIENGAAEEIDANSADAKMNE